MRPALAPLVTEVHVVPIAAQRSAPHRTAGRWYEFARLDHFRESTVSTRIILKRRPNHDDETQDWSAGFRSRGSPARSCTAAPLTASRGTSDR